MIKNLKRHVYESGQPGFISSRHTFDVHFWRSNLFLAMKIPCFAIVLSAIGSVGLRAQTPTTAASHGNLPAPTDYKIVQQDANSRVWQREIYEQEPNGQIVARPHQFTELATGLNYKDSSGQWQPSKEEIDIQPDGAMSATQGQHQVYFPGNIYGGEIELVQPNESK